MEDKVFKLLKMKYSEFSEFKKETNSKLVSIDNHITRLENKLEVNSKALFDGYKQNHEKLKLIENKVDNLADKVDRHDI